jgi:hypothetical protein
LAWSKVWTLDLCRGALRDGQQFLDRTFAFALLEPFVAIAQGFGDHVSHGLARGSSYGFGKTMGFGAFDVKRHVYLLVQNLPF